MPHEVKMPQLGMTQDSGVIVSWLKNAGDAVAEGDALFEVETDKATMEVGAQTAGYLAAVRAGEGVDVPVGDVIALIVESEAEVSDHTSETSASEVKPEESSGADPVSEQSNEAEAEPTSLPDDETVVAPESPPIAPASQVQTGKVLASPKARRLALERGIDLAALRAQGIAEPIHAADLASASTDANAILTARASGPSFDGLLQHSQDPDRTMLFAAFASGAWRTIFATEDIGVALLGLDGEITLHTNPDHGGGTDNAVSFTLLDICDTRLESYAPAGGGATITIAKNGEDYVLTFSFSQGVIALGNAVAVLDEFAARIEDPIRQIL